MKTLVTGATGLLGSELVRTLLANGHDVRILHRATSSLALLGDAAAEVERVVGDLSDPSLLMDAMEGVSSVFHAAAYVGFGGRRDWKRLYDVNVRGTALVLDAARAKGVERLVFTSSIAALGRSDAAFSQIDERANWEDSSANTAYALSKHLAELEVHRAIAEGLDAVIVNPALIFGLARAGENTRQIVESVRDRKLPGVPSGGTCVVDVKDVAEGHRLALERGRTGERYILGHENLSWREIIGVLADAFGVAPPRRTIPPALATFAAALSETVGRVTRTRPFLTLETARTSARTTFYDNSKAVEELGCTFRPFTETARRISAGM